MISLSHVWKEYQLGAGLGGLRTALGNIPQRLLRREPDPPDRFFALRDIDLQILPGEAVGLIGRNGAGKTTVLKLISKITQPTRGTVEVCGRVSALIELGAGFHPELTGRENIFLNGTILGLSRKEISSKLDAIVAFSELEKFIDTPVKRYSSGMYARLGFSVAAHTDPEVLLVDEVLAVGDRNFQEKCFKHILDFVNSEHTTVFVSHNLYAIEQLCKYVVWLDEGQIMSTGTPGEVLPKYFDFLDDRRVDAEKQQDIKGSRELRITEVKCVDGFGNPSDTIKPGEPITIEISYKCKEQVRKPHFVLAVSGGQGEAMLFLASMLVDGQAPAVLSGEGFIQCQFLLNLLTPKVYQVWGEVWAEDRQRLLVDWQKLGSFRILDDGQVVVGTGGVRHMRAGTPIEIPYKWVVY